MSQAEALPRGTSGPNVGPADSSEGRGRALSSRGTRRDVYFAKVTLAAVREPGAHPPPQQGARAASLDVGRQPFPPPPSSLTSVRQEGLPGPQNKRT